MSSESRKAAAFALGSSLEMLVLILMSFVIAAAGAGEPQSCDEYCALLLSGKIGSTWSAICNCHPQSEDKESDNTKRNLENNPIYYEPVEFHPLPEVSFVYQPFVISNPTLTNKVSATNEADQESEHHRKYKRKHDIIHKISIDTDRQPLYLDIDINNGPSQSRSYQDHINKLDNFHITEQDLKDCIDLHLLLHFRRNGSDDIPDVENLKKYFHISDADLITELNDRCNNPSNVVEQSLRHIIEQATEIKTSAFNSSESEDSNRKLPRNEENVYKSISQDDEMLGSSSSMSPQIIPAIAFHNNEDNIISTTAMFNQNNNYNERKRNSSSDTIDSKLTENDQNTTSRLDNLPDMSTALPVLLNANVKFNKEIQIDKISTTTNVPANPIVFDNTDSIQSNINYRAAFSKSKLEHNPVKSLIDTTALEKGNIMAKTERTESSHTNDNETTDTMEFDDIIANTEESITKSNTSTSLISKYTYENSNNNDLYIRMRDEDVTSTTHFTIISTDITTFRSLSRNDLENDASTLENDNKANNFLQERDASSKFKNKEQEKILNNTEYMVIKNRSAYELPSISNSQYTLNKSTKESHLNENILPSSEKNIHDPSSQTATDTHFVKKLTLGSDLLGADFTEKPNTDSTYIDTSLFASTTEKSHFVQTYENRKIITENKIKIPRIVVTEHLNDTVDSNVDGIEELPNNDYMTTDFDLDVADLTVNSVTWLSKEDNKSKQDESKKTHSDLDQVTDKHKHKKNDESSHINEISGKIYFMFRKHLIPMRFVQALDGKLNLSIDGESFCKNLLIDGKSNGIISTLCNSAVYNNNNCIKY